MFLGRVIGTVVATHKAEGLEGQKILMVQGVDAEKRDTGAPFAAIDTVRAGPGDLVMLVGAREAALALDESFVPVDATIIAIVDAVDLERRRQKRASDSEGGGRPKGARDFSPAGERGARSERAENGGEPVGSPGKR